MSTILVTGSTGNVGSRLVPRLLAGLDPRDTVRVLVRDASRAPAGTEVVEGDICAAADRAKALAGTDTVVNLAAAFRGVSDERARAVNHEAAVALAREGVEAGVRRFVHTSTNLVYSPGSARPLTEHDPIEPAAVWGLYAATKAATDKDLLGLRAELGLDLVILRLAFVYGDGDSHLRDFMPWGAGWAAHRRLPTVHHADVAQALLRVLRADRVPSPVYNVGDDAPLTVHELYALHGMAHPAEDKAVEDPWEALPDTTLLRRELGYRPLYPTVRGAADAGAL
ncbi:NAD-dependent epimerase/dehydratase family protein [Embleya sp. NBC_00896]|uniref:NAD-dependent epimerase/dehydratase family protein n=1 Tax=Embleya sp. NBC_00896 TaxID=2975961 RepID=UPI00386EAE3B|nr:NAD(P)-dependent oxidoreductase [Embleya sp. NBC_00896]